MMTSLGTAQVPQERARSDDFWPRVSHDARRIECAGGWLGDGDYVWAVLEGAVLQSSVLEGRVVCAAKVSGGSQLAWRVRRAWKDLRTT